MTIETDDSGVAMNLWGRKVTMTDWKGKLRTGEVTGPPIGSTKCPPGACYVQWDHLMEPAPAFTKDLTFVENK